MVPVYASTVLSMFAYSLVSVSLPFRFQALGLSVLAYGAVVAVFASGMLFTEGLFGALAYRIAHRGWILALGAAVAGLFLLLGFATTFATLAVSYALLGALFIFPIPLARWLALTARGPGTEGSGAARYAVFFGVGTITGSAVGPLLFGLIGFDHLVWVAAATWSVSIGVLAAPEWATSGLPRRIGGIAGPVRRVFTSHFAFLAFLVTLYFTCFALTTNFLQYYSVSLFGGSPADSGYIIGAARATTVVSGLLLGAVVDRYGPARSGPFGFLLLVAGALGTYFAGSFGAMILATLAFGVGSGWLSAGLLPLALGPVPLELQGTAVGVFGSFEDLGLLIGPAAIGAIYAGYGARAIFPFVAGIALVGMAGALWLHPRVARSRPTRGGSAGPTDGGSTTGADARAGPQPNDFPPARATDK